MSFAEAVYERLREVPAGFVTTYKDLAHAVGSCAYRAVGQAMRNNPDAPRTPCHRVVSSDGSIGGFMGEKGGAAIQKKIGLLREEGVEIRKGRVEEFSSRRFRFS